MNFFLMSSYWRKSLFRGNCQLNENIQTFRLKLVPSLVFMFIHQMPSSHLACSESTEPIDCQLLNYLAEACGSHIISVLIHGCCSL